jgi:hypothetical protein
MPFEKIAQYLGLGAPFVAASLFYSLFNFFDRKSSPRAKRALNAWIRGERYKQLDLRTAVIEGFDHLYGTPLLSARSFFRSAVLSMLVVVSYMMFMVSRGAPVSVELMEYWFFSMIGPTIVVDYISLFAVRRCLAISGHSLLFSIVLTLIVAAGAFSWLPI